MIAILALLAILAFDGIGGGGGAAPFVTPVPAVLNVFNDSPDAVKALDEQHPGQAAVITQMFDGSVRDWVLKSQSGTWINYGTSQPEPVAKDVGQWVVDAYAYWKTKGGGVLPYTVAAGPRGRGFAGPTPDGQDAAKKALAPIAK